MKKIGFAILGLLCLLLAFIGGLLPIIPGKLFLILSLLFFLKASKRFLKLFIKSKIYLDYLKPLKNKKISKFKKYSILGVVLFFQLLVMIAIKNYIL